MNKLKFISKQQLGKIILYMLMDVIIILFSLAFGLILRYEGVIPGIEELGVYTEVWRWYAYMSVFASFVCIAVYFLFHMYNNLWKYASIDEVIKIFVATAIIYIILYFFDLLYLTNKEFIFPSRRLLFISWAVSSILVSFSRFGYRLVKRLFIMIGHSITSKAGCKRVMVVGAGFAGYGVVRGMLNSTIRDKIAVIIVDPDIAKNNTTLLGVRVLGGISGIDEWAKKYEIDEIIIALPSMEPVELKEILEICTKTECSLKILPPLSDVSDGKIFGSIRDVSIADLLYREEVKMDNKNISEYLSNRVVLITGGGGSIGSELARQVAKFAPSLIVLFDMYEHGAMDLQIELLAKYNNSVNVKIRIGSIRDYQRVNEVFEEFKPHVVFHAAAHKVVPLLEDNKAEAVKNNIFGTLNLVKCADIHESERFILISTDKAVNPNNAYGATKRITELIVQDMASKSKTKYMVVRFGNVLGSNGSIVGLFKNQIAGGGPVTVTHPDVVRFFMTIPEATQLILQATSLGQSGRIFVLDMGTPIKIDDLARNMIKLSGLRPDIDIKVVYTKLRPGDKLYEELILDEEKNKMQTTCHKKIMVAKPLEMDTDKFSEQLEELYTIAHENPKQVESYLKVMVPTYTNSDLNNSK